MAYKAKKNSKTQQYRVVQKNHTKFGAQYILCQSACYQALYIILFAYVFLLECHINFKQIY